MILKKAGVARVAAQSTVGGPRVPEVSDCYCDNERSARRHAFGARVHLAACTAEALTGTFPIVVANLLPEELLPMRAAISARVASKGRLIVSGIPSEREGEVVSKLRARRWALGGCRRENGWTCVTLERG